MKRNNKGFTLAELLIVVAVIAVLVAVAIPTFGSQLEKSRQAVDKANLRDAYAAAQVWILNQNDGEDSATSTNPLKKANNGNTGASAKTRVYRFGFDGDTLTDMLGGDENAATEITDTQSLVGKATTNALADTSPLVKKITYTNDTLAKDDDTSTKVGTTTKHIVVSIKYDASTNEFTLEDVTFAYKAKGYTETDGETTAAAITTSKGDAVA